MRPSLLCSTLLVVALVLPACGESPPERATSISDVLNDPRDGAGAEVIGVASPIGSAGFVLRAGDDSIFVWSEPPPALRVDEGERVKVVGRVKELDPWQIDWVEDEIARRGGRRGRVDPKALRDAPFEEGAPYIELLNVRREDGT